MARTRIALRRLHAILPLVGILVLLLLLPIIVLSTTQLRAIALHNEYDLLDALATALMALQNETMSSYYYNALASDSASSLANDEANDHGGALWHARALRARQRATTAAMHRAAQLAESACATCTSFYDLVDMTALLTTQAEVRRRALDVAATAARYNALLTQTMESCCYYLGVALDEEHVRSVWLQRLTLSATTLSASIALWLAMPAAQAEWAPHAIAAAEASAMERWADSDAETAPWRGLSGTAETASRGALVRSAAANMTSTNEETASTEDTSTAEATASTEITSSANAIASAEATASARVLLVRAFNATALALQTRRLALTTAVMLRPYDGGVASALVTATADSAHWLTAAMAEVRGDYAGLSVRPWNDTTVWQFVHELEKYMTNWVGFVGTESGSTWRSTESLYTILVLAAVAAALVAVSMAAMIRDIGVDIFGGDAAAQRMQERRQLEASLRRMGCFLDAAARLDGRGMAAVAAVSRRCTGRTTAESELLKLGAAFAQVMGFISPCVTARYVRYLRAGSSASLGRAAADETTGNDATRAEEVGRFGQTAQGIGNRSRHVAAAAAAAAGARLDDAARHGEENGPMREDDAVVRRTDRSHVCLLLADMMEMHLHAVGSETNKTLPKTIAALVRTLGGIARAYGAVSMGTSGSLFLCGWNVALDEQELVEDAACAMLLELSQTLVKSNPTVRYALISSTCVNGIVGSDTLRSYILGGPLMLMARLLLKVAEKHRLYFVVDNLTSLRMQKSGMYKRALEKIALNPQCLGVEDCDTIAFELTPMHATEKENVMLWNTAFDELHSGLVASARRRMTAWQQRFGVTASSRRFLSLINKEPTPPKHTFLISPNMDDLDLLGLI